MQETINLVKSQDNMNYFQSSPWQDAARYGQGLAETLGQVFINAPMQRAQIAMHQQQINQSNMQAQRQFDLQKQQLGQDERHFQDEISIKKRQVGAVEAMDKAHEEYYQHQAQAPYNMPGVGAIVPNQLGGVPSQPPGSNPDNPLNALISLLGKDSQPGGSPQASPMIPQGYQFMPKQMGQAAQPNNTRVVPPGSVVTQGGQPTYTNTQQRVSAPAKGQQNAQVKVINKKTGQAGFIPKENLQKAIQSGNYELMGQ